MINTIEPDDFASMIPEVLMAECNHHMVSLSQIKKLCTYLNNMREGIPVQCNVTIRRLRALGLVGCRFTNLKTKQTYLIKHLRHNLEDYADDWKVELINEVNFITKEDGKITWTIAKAEGKRYPKAYKEFLKCVFLGAHMPTINKLDSYYDRYIKAYNEIYQNELAKQHV